MHALLGLQVQSKVSSKVTFVGRKNSLFAQPKTLAHITAWLEVRVLPAPPHEHFAIDVSVLQSPPHRQVVENSGNDASGPLVGRMTQSAQSDYHDRAKLF
jgi:hypothetical protein